MEKVVVDAQVIFYFHYDSKKLPTLLHNLKITVIIPTIAIAELFWKMRKAGKINQMRIIIRRWETSENIIIDNFDLDIIRLMLNNQESHELHDEIIAMTFILILA